MNGMVSWREAMGMGQIKKNIPTCTRRKNLKLKKAAISWCIETSYVNATETPKQWVGVYNRTKSKILQHSKYLEMAIRGGWRSKSS